jgi:hypothetical protein
MITPIIEGMTPTAFLAALNANFALVIANYTTVTNLSTSDLQTLLNTNFSKSDVYLGIKGSSFASIINANYNSYDVSISKPTSHSITWINDFARHTFTDHSGGIAQHELWESRDGSAYVLAYTFAAGVTTYDYYTWQNSSLNYRIRAKNGSAYSEFTSIVNIVSPLVFKTDQSTLNTITFDYLRTFIAGKTIHVDWGDGTSVDCTSTNYTAITKTYSATQNPYFVTISGDVDYISWIQGPNNKKCYGDLTKWRLPNSLAMFHFYNNNFSGDISGWVLPSTIGIFHIGVNNFSGDLTNFYLQFKPSQYEIRLNNNNFTGDLTHWTFPTSPSPYLFITLNNNAFTGDISGWTFPALTIAVNVEHNLFACDLSAWRLNATMCFISLNSIGDPDSNNGNIFTGNLTNWGFANIVAESIGFLMYCQGFPFTGDLSGVSIPSGTTTGGHKILRYDGCHLTKMPRGYFNDVTTFNFSANSCNSAEIDSLLAYVDAYFVGGVVPLCNCVYTLNGTGMGIPSAAGLASRASIIAKYVTAGFTATIYVNS